jgi:hypothetical protein
MTLREYRSRLYCDLKVVINTDTGEVYATQKALARFIEKRKHYIRNHELSKFSANKDHKIENAEFHTNTGTVTDDLYNEYFMCSLFAAYDFWDAPKVMMVGIREYFSDYIRIGVPA